MTRFLYGLILAVATHTNFAPAQEKPVSGDDSLQQADQLVQSHQLEKANELLAEFVQQHPENEAASIKLGQIELALGLYEDALKSFESILTTKPNVQDARDGEVKAAEAEALADQKAGIDGSALMCLIRARKFVPDSPQLLLDFGMQAERMRIYHDADEALTKAHELAPQDLKILYALSRVQSRYPSVARGAFQGSRIVFVSVMCRERRSKARCINGALSISTRSSLFRRAALSIQTRTRCLTLNTTM